MGKTISAAGRYMQRTFMISVGPVLQKLRETLNSHTGGLSPKLEVDVSLIMGLKCNCK